MAENIRPTKKQRELLSFIETFIAEHGFSPSYREIMTGLQYTSVSTVALHINSLIKRGHLFKRDHSARSLEVASPSEETKVHSNAVSPKQEKWLVEKVEHLFAEVESLGQPDPIKLDELHIMVGALKVLGIEGAVQVFAPRLTALKSRPTT